MRKHTILKGLLGISMLFAFNANAQTSEVPDSHLIGSWFGKAEVDNPWCEIGTEGCPVPPEIVMLPTFFSDGNFMGIDSNVFLGEHTEAHGQWVRKGRKRVEANWLFLQSTEDGGFAGAFRMRLRAESLDADNMRGSINAYFMPFTDENGFVVEDPATGLPVPDPLGPLPDYKQSGTECNPQVDGCFGVFKFDIRRIKVTLDD